MVNRSSVRVVAVLFLLSLVALCGGATAFAQTPAAPKTPQRLVRGPFAPMVRQLQGLGLTQEQRQQVLGIFSAHGPEVKAIGEKVRAARARWQQAGQIDIQERKALMAERQAVVRSVTGQVVGVLTPEQQKKFQARRQRAARRLGR